MMAAREVLSVGEITQLGIVGAGRMGAGIAQVCAISGCEIVVCDTDRSISASAMATMEKKLARCLDRGELSADEARAALARVTWTDGLAAMAGVDMVVEAVSETFAIKSSVFSELASIVSADCIRASTTSSISITKLAAASGQAPKFIGLHFMNPVPAIKLVEVIRGLATDQQTYDSATHFVAKLGKTVVDSEDFPGFIVNRILLPMINEAIYTLYEGVGSVATIDTAMQIGTNHPMGPLALADFIGLDTVLGVMQTIHDGLSDTKYRPCPLLVKYVAAGWTGRKAGRGFYDYRSDPPIPTR